MNNVEAKFILQGYRSNGADAGDAAFCAALDQARQDPALRQWFELEQAFDRAISAKLAEVPAPAGLREAILAGGRVSAGLGRSRVWWRHPAVFALAAAVAVLLTAGLLWWPHRPAASNSLTEFAVADSLYGMTHGHSGRGEETRALQVMLSQPNAHLSHGLPVDFATLRSTGCRTISFQGHELLEVCFQRDGIWFHCYIANRADFSALAAISSPVFTEKDGFGAATWTDKGHIYLVVGKATRTALERLL